MNWIFFLSLVILFFVILLWPIEAEEIPYVSDNISYWGEDIGI